MKIFGFAAPISLALMNRPFLFLLGLWVLVSCDSKVKVITSDANPTDTTQNQTPNESNPASGDLDSPIEFSTTDLPAAKGGELVKITGKNFKTGMSAMIDGHSVPLEVIDSENATFVMPAGLDSKLVNIAIQVANKTLTNINLVSIGNDDKLPILIIDPEFVCNNIEYHNAQGDVVFGKRDCSPKMVNCTTDGQIDCISNNSFKATDALKLTANNIRAGVTVAGVAGAIIPESHGDCSTDGAIGCVTTTAYKSADMTSVIASNIMSGISIAGVAGSGSIESHSSCNANAQTGCIATSTYKSADLTNLAAGNIKSGVSIAGVAGSVVAESHSSCAADGATGCVTTASYKSADMTAALAGNILSGTTIAGVAGSATAESHSNCSGNAQTGCVSTATYQSADLTNLAAGNIKSGVSIAGVAGSVVVESHSNCTGNAQTGCVSTATYQSADLTNLAAGNVKSGVTVAGVTGDYPSATNPLTGDTTTADLDLATFNAKIKSSSNFEWWDASGTHYVNAGDTNLTASNILSTATIFGTTGSVIHTTPTASNLRYGVSVNGVTGTLKTACRNLSRTATFDNTTTPAVTGADFYDTFDWYNDPLDSPWGTTEYTCNASLWTAGGTDSGVTAGYCNDASDECTMTDTVTGLSWSKSYNAVVWQTAVDSCDALTYGGYSDWRLPTQIELMTAYTHNMRSAANNYWATTAQMSNNTWTSTISSQNTANAWFVYMTHGFTSNGGARTVTTYKYFCVR